jgi:hypothetical protein
MAFGRKDATAEEEYGGKLCRGSATGKAVLPNRRNLPFGRIQRIRSAILGLCSSEYLESELICESQIESVSIHPALG